MRAISRIHLLLPFVLVAFWVIVLLLPCSAFLQPIPKRDSGVFLYIGQQILHGQMPYHDVWDHKGPLVYYVNALGLFLAHGSRWGVWCLQYLTVIAAALIGYIALGRAYGYGPSAFASLLWLSSLVFVLGDGNYTEQYALPFQFLAIAVFARAPISDGALRCALPTGITLAILFWLKPTTIGVPLSIAAVSVVSLGYGRRWLKAITWGLAAVGGALIVTIPVVAYFVWRGAWLDLLDAAIRYNMVYITSTLTSKIGAIMEGLQLLARSGIVFLAVAAWIVGGVTLFCRFNYPFGPRSLLHLSLIGMPVEFILAGGAGRPYEHYYLTWLPLFAVLTAQFVSHLSRYFAPIEISCFGRRGKAGAVWMVALLMPMVLQSALALLRPIANAIQTRRPAVPDVVKRIWSYTGADDYLLMWGAEARYNFVAARTAPSRFVYQYPLYTCGYVTDAMVTEFANDIARHKPLIIDTSSTNPVVPPLTAAGRRKWGGQAFAGAKEDCKPLRQMAALFAFIDTHYRVAEVIQPEGWVILQYTDGP